MGRARHCSICTGDLAITGQVNTLIESGVRQKLIHAEHPQFSVSQISRHTRHCLAPKPMDAPAPETRSAQIARWLQRAESTYALATVNGDSRSAIAAVGAATRALTQLEKQVQAEALAVSKAVADPNDVQFTIQQIDALMQRARATAQPGSAIDDYGWLCSLNSGALALFRRVAADPALLEATAQLATPNYQPERKQENAHAND